MERGYWYSAFAPNGWVDWFCGACKKRVHNDDVHVSLDWKYCPYCGDKKMQPIRNRSVPDAELPKSNREYLDWLLAD